MHASFKAAHLRRGWGPCAFWAQALLEDARQAKADVNHAAQLRLVNAGSKAETGTPCTIYIYI